MEKNFSGTLALDLGNTNTVIAFQDEKGDDSILIDIPEITSSPGVIPTVVWFEGEENMARIGVSALKKKNLSNSEIFYHSNFKRLIGNPIEKQNKKFLSPIESGEKFFRILWENIPKEFEIKRLVLTTPIDTYKGYRKWLINLCKDLPINEVALVDEPTAAGIGINIPLGSRIMIIDMGGSTIDMSVIRTQGGEGKSAPIAELLKFQGRDVSTISKQKIRCAEIISKSGSKIGGKDIDQWIVNYFLPSNLDERNLSIAEKLKCKLSAPDIKYERRYSISLFTKENEEKEFFMTKEIFEKILMENNLFNHLNSLLKDLLNEARGNFCKIDDLYSVILVGGGTQIPLIKEWISNEISGILIKSPPPIESIAVGALAMTPGVKLKDILIKGISIKLFNKREQKHFWHPIFCKGQTWPTEKPFELILQASKDGQNVFEIIIGETKTKRDFDVIFENGLPKLSEFQNEEEVLKWDKKPLKIILKNNCKIGKDSLKLYFRITNDSSLYIRCEDINEKELGEFNLGSIF
tara:strand:- start:253 stop:1818 length:1566 start_codon:yes stop_codon:yes gene_type:complete